MLDKTPSAAEIGAKGGKARAKSMTPEERSASAKRAVEARWNRVDTKDLLVAPHNGELSFGELKIPCSVLVDGTRVVSERGVLKALGIGRSGYAHNRAKADAESGEGGGAALPLFVAPINLKPFIDLELASVLQNPIWYCPTTGPTAGRPHKGLRAELLPKVCGVWLKARDAGVIRGARQAVAVVTADILLRGLATVGIAALVDEATGYQDARARDALAKILEAYIAKELRGWVRTFDPDFYKEMFRLRGLPYDGSIKRPQYIGCITNDVVYSRLAPGVLEELRRKNPTNENGRRKNKHHQWLTDNYGNPELRAHLKAVVALMRIFDSWEPFYAALDRALPKFAPLPLLDWAEKENTSEC